MTLDIIQLALAILLTGAVLIQTKNAGLGSIFGGSDNVQTTRRGVEQKLHITTIVIAVLFFAVSLINVLY
ncbi:preprotein translocase subunit SecG [Candidatus Uhrbacteria bacterium]|jgi:protein translocase SecG subunit|nr:preprotein translocase subunit SecG [Candidatus Uhrbacteria bacterium]MBT7716847.1 preprotein translocase subunit SecG [Candidatus Uhrbacteria bacterium]